MVVVGSRDDESTSTVDVVDDGFKLRSHPHQLCSILTHVSTIKKVNFSNMLKASDLNFQMK